VGPRGAARVDFRGVFARNLRARVTAILVAEHLAQSPPEIRRRRRNLLTPPNKNPSRVHHDAKTAGGARAARVLIVRALSTPPRRSTGRLWFPRAQGVPHNHTTGPADPPPAVGPAGMPRPTDDFPGVPHRVGSPKRDAGRADEETLAA